MEIVGMSPQFIPQNPPGYIFVTNSSYLDIDRKPRTIKSIQENISQKTGIPVEELLTLEKVCSQPFSTFALEKHSELINNWHKGISELFNLFLGEFGVGND